ncbi:MAG: SpoIIIAH-like family protein [Eubacteriaceae bacterium]|nr:SpoIIIAH-like family protein [Eubacteriaceae bacterium]
MKFIKKIKLNKRGAALIILTALLVGMTIINYKLSDSLTAQTGEDDPMNAELVSSHTEQTAMSGTKAVDKAFFSAYRLEREQARSADIEILQDIAENTKATDENAANAQAEMIYLVKLNEMELSVENRIKAKGFADCIVFIHEDHANVLVDCDTLTAQDAIQIQDIVESECKVGLENIAVSATGGN